MLSENIASLKASFREQLAAATDKEALEALRVAFLGKKGAISELMKDLREMTPDEKREAGQFINEDF